MSSTTNNGLKEAVRPATAARLATKQPRLRHTPGGATLGKDAGHEARRLAAAVLEVLAGADAGPGGRGPGGVAAALLPDRDTGHAGVGSRLRTEAARPRAKCRQGADRPKASARTLAAGAEPAANAGAAGAADHWAGAAQAAPVNPGGKDRSKKRRRRPVVRALRAAEQLQRPSQEAPPATTTPARPTEARMIRGKKCGRHRVGAAREPRDDSFMEETIMRGRIPAGPEMVEHLEGSDKAKERLRLILETMTGGLRVQEACACLDICEQRFRQLRAELLQAALASLEDQPAGRPRRPEESEQTAALRQQLQALQRELQAAQVREEIALGLPHVRVSPGVPAVSAEAPALQKKRRRGTNVRRRRCVRADRGEQCVPRIVRNPCLPRARAAAYHRASHGSQHAHRGWTSISPSGIAAVAGGPSRGPTAAAWSSSDRASVLAGTHPPGGRRLLPHIAQPRLDAATVRPATAPLATDAALLGPAQPPGLPQRNDLLGAGGAADGAVAVAGASSHPRLPETDRTGHRCAELAGTLP